jgi:hypothetical protein
MKKTPNIKGILHFLSHYLDYLPWIALVIASIVFLVLLTGFVLRLLSWKGLLRRKMVCLELTPPAFTPTSVQSNQKLLNVLHGLKSHRPLKDKLLMRPVVWSQEIGSVRENGIRFQIRAEERLVPAVQNYLHSFLPDAKLAVVPDFLPELPDNAQVIEFKLVGHYAFPLAAHNFLEDHDPVAFLTTIMNQLESKEFMGFQLVFTPVRLKEAAGIAHRATHNEELLAYLNGHNTRILSKLNNAFAKVSFELMDLISYAVHTPASGQTSNSMNSQRQAYDRLQVAKGLKPARTLSTFEEEMVAKIKDKVSQPLFRVSIRAVVVMEDLDEARERINTLQTSLQSYSVPGYQGLKPKVQLPFAAKYRRFAYRNRLPALINRDSCVLSASEIASLYHFPIGDISRTDNLVTSLSRTLAAPISLKQNTGFDVVLGQNIHHDLTTDIGLTESERERHIYIIGGTGAGKTTMLQYAIVQDIRNGKGVAVIDPHGDLAETILKHIPKDRLKDVVYFNPDDLEHPIGLNLLEVKSGKTGIDLQRDQAKITEAIISIFRKIFSDEDTGGHRIEYVLRNTIETAFTVPDATLFTVLKLIQSATFRKEVIDKLESEDLKDFWKNELGQAGNMQRVKMSAGITAKVGRFRSSPSSKLVLQQVKSTIDFDDIINSKKILICNFAKGALGEDTSQLFGIATLAMLQLAAYRRVHMDKDERVPFYLYVDEFQNFATPSFVQMLSESRKYKLLMTMAEQSTSQQKDLQMVNIILANVGTVVCFRTGNPADEKLLLPLFAPYISEREISNLSAYNFYARLSAIRAQEPVSGETVLLDNEGSKEVAKQVTKLSRKTYGKLYEPPVKPSETTTSSKGQPSANTKTKDERNQKLKPKKDDPKDEGYKGYLGDEPYSV